MRRAHAPTFLLAGVLALGLGAGPAAGQDGEVVSLARSDLRAARLGGRGLDLLMEKDGRVYIVASPGQRAALSALRVPFALETPRLLQAGLLAASAGGGLNGAYHSPLELETDLRVLERDHPGLARLREIGRTLEGRPLYALKISDNAAVEEGEPAALFVGCHHAREWISVEVPYLFGKRLLEGYADDPAIRSLVDECEVWIIPAANPDGLDYSIYVYRYWRKNRRANADGTFGVDLNRNYGFAWGRDDAGSSGRPGSDVYRGTAPFSEPETAAIRGLVSGRDLRAMVSFHSYSQTILYPWGFTVEPSPGNVELAAVAGTMAGLIGAVHGAVYAAGQASSSLYLTNGDTVDWAHSLAGAPAYTIELPPVDVDHGGFFNDEAAIATIFEENLPALLYLTRYAIDHPREGGPVRPIRRAPARPALGRGPAAADPAGLKPRR